MKNENKKTLDEMITKMLANADELNAEQMQIVDLLCAINESETIASNVHYEACDGTDVDNFKDFILENEEQIWDEFNDCRTIDKLVLLNSKHIAGIQEDSRIIVDFVYTNGSPDFCYVRIVYNKVDKDGSRRMIYNWNENSAVCDFSLDEIKKIKDYHKKSDFFFKIKF